MKQTLTIQGMHCQSCVGRVTKALEALPNISAVTVDLAGGSATIDTPQALSETLLVKQIADAGSYTAQLLSAEVKPSNTTTPSTIEQSFKPLLIVVGYLLLGTAIATYLHDGADWMFAMRVFMGLFFVAFSFFKMLDIAGFADSYRMYDIVAKQWSGWGKAYPFVELSLGIGYLLNCSPLWLNVATIVILGVSAIGVIKAVLSKTQIRCACLGTGFNLPMTTLTIIEDVGMVAMAAAMLIFG